MKKVIILILLIFTIHNAKAQFYADMLYSDIDPLSAAHIRVGNYGSGELVSGSVFNNVDSAVKYSRPGSLITIMPGQYHTKVLKINKSLNIFCKSGVEIIGDSTERIILIADTTGSVKIKVGNDSAFMGRDVNVKIKGYANFTNLSIRLFGGPKSALFPQQTTLIFECNVINAGSRTCLYWSNVKDIICRFKKAVGGNNLFDSDDYGGNVYIEGDTVINTEAQLFNFHNTYRLNIKFANMRIVDQSSVGAYLEVVGEDNGIKEFENVFYSGISPIEIIDQREPQQLNYWVFKNSTFNFTGDNSFLINSDFNIPLISTNSSTNKPIGGYSIFAPITGDFTAP